MRSRLSRFCCCKRFLADCWCHHGGVLSGSPRSLPGHSGPCGLLRLMCGVREPPWGPVEAPGRRARESRPRRCRRY
eukprot:5484489-Pyramimonas_sp.AAC.1